MLALKAVLVGTLFTFACAAFAQAEQLQPRIFAKVSLVQAQARAKKEKKFVIADFTASWCGPCRMMDEQTWVDDNVEKWIKSNAIAVQVDVDKDRATSRKLDIRAMPTVIVFAPPDTTKEADRDQGFKGPDELLLWLDAVKSGKPAGDKESLSYESARGKGGTREVKARFKHAERTMAAGDNAAATTEYIWLWQNVEKESPEMVPVRATLVAQRLSELYRNYAAARGQLDELRAAARANDRTADWLMLNDVTGHQDDTVKWFDSVKNDPGKKDLIDQMGPALIDLLVEKGRWADVGKLWGNPTAELQARHEWAREVHDNASDHPNLFPKQAALIYASLLAAGRKDEAAQIAEESLKLQNTREMRDELDAAVVAAKITDGGSSNWLIAAVAVGAVSLLVALFFLMNGRKQAGS